MAIAALILALFALFLAAAIGAATQKMDEAINRRLQALELPRFQAPSQAKGDQPAFARNHNPDGPSGHALHGHPPVHKTPGETL